MRRSTLTLAAIGLLVLGAAIARPAATGTTNSGPAGAGPAAAPSADERLGLGLSDELTDIYLQRDLGRLRKILAPEYLGTAPGTRWDAARLAAEFPNIEMQAMRRLDYTAKRLAPDLLLFNEDAELYESYRGKSVSGAYRMTTIWSQRNGRWLLLFEQEVELPAPPGPDQPPPEVPPPSPTASPPAAPPSGGR